MIVEKEEPTRQKNFPFSWKIQQDTRRKMEKHKEHS